MALNSGQITRYFCSLIQFSVSCSRHSCHFLLEAVGWGWGGSEKYLCVFFCLFFHAQSTLGERQTRIDRDKQR